MDIDPKFITKYNKFSHIFKRQYNKWILSQEQKSGLTFAK